MMKRLLFCFCYLFVLLFLLSPDVWADEKKEAETLPDVYQDLLNSLPPSILERIPEGALSNQTDDVGNAVGEMSSFSYLLQAVLSLVGLRLGDCLKLLCSVVGILILSSICRTFCASLKKPELARAFSFMITLIITVTIFATGFGTIESTVSYFG
ncbi:MAG: hypothetical protein IJV73_03650, partial [Clostridia bacterium]|nr:hypothetical protein [Clostridia bacterium]